MASAKSRRARQRRNPHTAPRAVPSERRATQARREAAQLSEARRATRRLGTEGERPRGLFGAVPVSEVAILAGLVAAVVGFVGQTTVPLVTGLVICALGTLEVTGREHFTGYRSHAALLAGIPAIAIEAGIVIGFGGPSHRLWLLAIVVPVFGLLFLALRRRFAAARQARVARTARGLSA
jgi:type IV secretory pathway TrbD component